jgi:serine/threonine protein kinase
VCAEATGFAVDESDMIAPEQLIRGEKLASTNVSAVCAATLLLAPGQTVACVIKTPVLAGEQQRLQREMACLRMCRSEFVAPLLGITCSRSGEVSLVLERLPCTLRQHLDSNPRLTMQQRVRLALHFARGVHYVHSCRVVHGDLKAKNTLYATDGTLKLCDFGLAKVRARRARCCVSVSNSRRCSLSTAKRHGAARGR